MTQADAGGEGPLIYKSRDTDVFVPDGLEAGEALARTTHLCIGAHQDDQEFMAYHGIAACYGNQDAWFSGVTVTNGSGSSRTGLYAETTDAQMMQIRRMEQRKAAMVGEYGVQVQLGYPSAVVKDPSRTDVVDDIEQILRAAAPTFVYLHNPADKHDTHVAVFLRCLSALRRLPTGQRPQKVYGCEIWRGLDWLPDEEKVILDAGGRPNLAAALSGIFDSQIAGGKRYDLAVQGRRMANATFFESHAVDSGSGLSFAMDLTPLILDDELDPLAYATGFVERLTLDVAARIQRYQGAGRDCT